MLIDDIRESVKNYIPTSVFSYGRSFDTSLEVSKESIQDYFIHLDPLTYNGKLNDATESATINLGFLLQDKPDSSYDKDENLDIDDSIEEIQANTKLMATNWLNYFLDNYSYSDAEYEIMPITRIKNVMSGILLKIKLSYKTPC